MKNRSAKIMAYLAAHPNAIVKEVAEKFRVTPPYVYTLRKQMARGTAGVLPLPKEPITAPQIEKVDTVLDTRAVEYGKFKDGAALMQALKRTLSEHAQKHHKTFADDQWEALEMIIHKMARIVNGNPDNVDSWLDIAGYATLVADRLEGRAR